jgi:hypothetical protein
MKYRLVWLLVEGTHGLSFGQEVPTKRPSPSPLLSAQIKNSFTEFFSRAVELQCDSVAHYFTILFFVLSNWTLFINVNHTFSQHAHCIQMENDSKLNYYIKKKKKKWLQVSQQLSHGKFWLAGTQTSMTRIQNLESISCCKHVQTKR